MKDPSVLKIRWLPKGSEKFETSTFIPISQISAVVIKRDKAEFNPQRSIREIEINYVAENNSFLVLDPAVVHWTDLEQINLILESLSILRDPT